jgi:hypothetical protein
MFTIINPLATAYRYTCLSSDTKLTAGILTGAVCKETDTRKEFIFNGTAWVPDIATTTLAHTAILVGALTAVVLVANANRRYALLVNDSDAVIYIKIGAAAVASEGIRLNSNGGSYEMSDVYGNLDTRVINAISSAEGKTLLVTEGV